MPWRSVRTGPRSPPRAATGRHDYGRFRDRFPTIRRGLLHTRRSLRAGKKQSTVRSIRFLQRRPLQIGQKSSSHPHGSNTGRHHLKRVGGPYTPAKRQTGKPMQTGSPQLSISSGLSIEVPKTTSLDVGLLQYTEPPASGCRCQKTGFGPWKVGILSGRIGDRLFRGVAIETSRPANRRRINRHG